MPKNKKKTSKRFNKKTHIRLDGPEEELEERLMRDEIDSDKEVNYAINYSVVFLKQSN